MVQSEWWQAKLNTRQMPSSCKGPCVQFSHPNQAKFPGDFCCALLAARSQKHHTKYCIDAALATVYPKKYAHGFCFAVLCCGYTLTDFSISIRLTSLALWQSNDCPSASKATLMNMDKYFMWIHYERLHNHNKAKHNKTVCIFLGIYCTLPVDMTVSKAGISVLWWCHDMHMLTMAHFLSLTRSKLRLCSANHRAGYFSNLACDWLSIVWAYSKQETENGPILLAISTGNLLITGVFPSQRPVIWNSYVFSFISLNQLFNKWSWVVTHIFDADMFCLDNRVRIKTFLKISFLCGWESEYVITVFVAIILSKCFKDLYFKMTFLCNVEILLE